MPARRTPWIALCTLAALIGVARPCAAQEREGGAAARDDGTRPGPFRPEQPAERKPAAETPELSFRALLQTQLRSTTVTGERSPEIFLRRLRVGVRAVFGKLSGFIEPGFVREDAVLNEAYARLELHEMLAIVAGKASRPFAIIDALDDFAVVPIERGARIPGLRTLEQYRLHKSLAYVGRSLGAQITGELEDVLGLRYAAGYFRGARGEDLGGDPDIRQFAAHVSIVPRKRLRIGAAFTNRDFACTTCDGRPNERASAVALDAQLGRYGDEGTHLLAQVSAGVLDPFEDANFVGAQGWAAHRFTVRRGLLGAVEPLIRVSWASPTKSESPNGGVLVTSGLNVYFATVGRLALNHDAWFSESGARASSAKVQWQVAF